ncbi:MAG TPA: dihydrofolate reductase family protein [Streptosporangiaceae bacterium]|nr:dihydrofolate reductase family protein [Streptosporangiaceae bacterium]
MTERPYVVLSCAISLDGCLDSTGPDRLVLSSGADLDRVDGERAAADAILVGAGTIRRDNPRLLIRSASRRAARVARGLPEHPLGVTMTASGDLDPAARFFVPDWPGVGPVAGRPLPPRLVYCAGPAAAALRARLGDRAEVAGAGDPPQLGGMLADLAQRGVGRLVVEGGARLGTEFLTGGLVDELHLVIAPCFVGDPAAPRFAGPGSYPGGPGSRLSLAEVRRIGDVVLLRYLATSGSALDGRLAQVNEAPDD